MSILTERKKGIVFAAAAAVLFGLSPPVAKTFLQSVHPLWMAGLLYLGAGAGLGAWHLLQMQNAKLRSQETALHRADWPWLAGAVTAGGVVAPVLLMLGLVRTPASNAALLLNLEGVFTAALAWFVFKENFDTRIVLGMALIVVGGVCLSWVARPEPAMLLGLLAIAAACLAWSIDNNLTRHISASDPIQIVAIKGLVAGVINCAVAYFTDASLPAISWAVAAGTLGFFSYGLSLTFYVLALRNIGTARTGAYFSVAPFVGAAISIPLLGEHPSMSFWIAAALMGVGVWLHLSERHQHVHTHKEMEHEHSHVHDEHHQHTHTPLDPPSEPHSHRHHHEKLEHSHVHFPDIHHRHDHP